MPTRRTARRRGFTLIEILAVVLIIGLTFGFFLPNLDSARARRLERQAREVAALLQVARERAVVTGAAHRVWIDIEAGAMRIEWFVDEKRALRASGVEDDDPRLVADATVLDARGRRVVTLRPPDASQREYRPVPNRFGELSHLAEEFVLVGVDTPEDGFIDRGEAWIVFYRDGTTEYAEIVLADDRGNEVVLVIEPLLDVVRVRPAEDPT